MKKDLKKFLEKNFRSSRKSLTFEGLFNASSSFFESVDSGVSLGCYLRLKHREYEQYLEMGIDPNDYLEPDAFFFDYQSIKLFSKAEFFPRVKNTTEEAMRSFINSEIQCYKVNSEPLRFNGPRSSEDYVESGILYAATRKIEQILGPCPSLDTLDFRFGPGNNVNLHNNTSVHDKLSADLTYTSNLAPFLPRILASAPTWMQARVLGEVPSRFGPLSLRAEVQLVYGSELGFVPKTAKTERTICTEPLLNSYVQLGIGKYIRSRLKRAGCDTTDQTRNQQLARQGSISGRLATIDLSAASDMISKAAVWHLLPEPWYDLLNTCRSPAYTHDGNFYEMQKFSSMGNGYTFELETLIFLSLARATCAALGLSAESVSVFGDDIIVPSDAYVTLCKVLDLCGFTVNQTKSFYAGPFRESCGCDWFLGAPVRPLFLKRNPTNATLMGWCNHIRRLDPDQLDPRWTVLYDALKSLVMRQFHRLVGPDGYGDGHFIESDRNLREKLKSRFYARGWEGDAYYTLSSSPIHRVSSDPIAYTAALYGLGDAPDITTGLDPVAKESHQSIDGYLAFSRRKKTRTVLRRCFHPWRQGKQ
jgi:hypothetical protein